MVSIIIVLIKLIPFLKIGEIKTVLNILENNAWKRIYAIKVSEVKDNF